MEKSLRLLIVEDEMLIGANLSLELVQLGYEVTGIIPRGEEAVLQVQSNPPDLVLMDIQLKGKLDGIETVTAIQQTHPDLPVIYLTSNTDEATFNRAKATRPHAFIAKPFRKTDLQRAIEIAVAHAQERLASQLESTPLQETRFTLNDRIFVRSRDRLVKILIQSVHYLQAERNYTRIFTTNKEYLLSLTLKHLEEKLPTEQFVRIHRSYMVNVAHIEEVGDIYVIIGRKELALSRNMRDDLLKRLHTF